MKLNFVALTVALLLTSQISFGQLFFWRDTTRLPYSYWLSMGLGATSTNEVSLEGNAAFEVGRHGLLTLAFQRESTDPNQADRVELTSVNATLGRVYKRQHTLYMFSAGLGVSQYINYSTDDKRTVPNLPLSVKQYWVIAQSCGIGFGTYANLNTIHPTWGINLNYALGFMFTHKPTGRKPKEPKRTHW